MVNILRLSVAYLNATINVKPQTQNGRLEPTGWRVRVGVWPAKSQQVRFLAGSGTEPARFCFPNPDPLLTPVQEQVEKVKSYFIQWARDNIAELYDLHRFESAVELLEFINSLLALNKYTFPIAERVEGVGRGPHPTQRESKAATEWVAFTLIPGGSNPAVCLHRILSSGE